MKLDIMPRDMFAEKEGGSLFNNYDDEHINTLTSTEKAPETEEANSSEIAAEESTNSTIENYSDFDNNFTTPVDYSWIAQVDVDDDLLNEEIEKSNVESTDISREYDDAWNYADPFNPFREKETLQEQLKNDFDVDAYEQNTSERFLEEARKFRQTMPEKTKDRRDNTIRTPAVSPGSIRGKLEEVAKNSPMYAKSGISTELNNPETHEQTKKETMEKEGAKDPLKESGLFSEEEIKDIRSRFEEPNTAQKVFGKASEFLIPFAGKTIKETIAPEPIKNQKAYIDALIRFKENNPLGYAESKKALDEAYEGSRKGSFTHGLDYYALTGDTNGNAYAESIDKVIKELPEDTPKEVIDKMLNPDPITREQINNLSMEAEKNNKIKSLAIEEATMATTSLALGLAAPYIKAGLGKIIEKIPEEVSNKITEKIARIALRGDKGEAFWNNLLEKKIEAGGQTFKLGDLVSIQNLKKSNVTVGETFKNMYNGGVNNPDTALSIVTGVQKALEEAGLRIVEKGADVAGGVSSNLINRLIAESAVDAGLAKKAAVVAGAGAGALEVIGASTVGIFDDKGRMIDTKDIVAERKDNPYEGEDKVELYTREGKVSVSPREAAIIGEGENLPESSGYTKEVKDAAKGSEVYEQPEVQMVQPSDEQIGFWQRAGDVVQAILGGRDLNNDRTITKSEWYQSTIGKIVNKLKPSIGSDSIDKVGEKSVFTKIKDKLTGLIDNIGKSVPGVVDLKTGQAYINPALDRPNLDLSPEAIRGTIETGIVDSMPDWNDDTGTELKKNIAASVVNEALAQNIFGNFGLVTAAKWVGDYATSTISEIAHLYGHDLDNDEKGALNFVITNAVGLPLAPVSTLVRDAGTSAYGMASRQDIEDIFKNGSNVSSGYYIIPYNGGVYPQKSSYGVSSGGSASAKGKYSGYREQAKDSNLATDYNEGMEQDVNEAVSDMKVKIFSVYNNEPDYIRNAIGKILKSFKENY